MKSIQLKRVKTILIALCLTALYGCQSSSKKETNFVIGLYQFTDYATRYSEANMMMLPTLDNYGKKISVHFTPEFSSQDFVYCRLVETQYGKALELTLTPGAVLRWQEVSTRLAGEKVAVIIDSIYYFPIKITTLRHSLIKKNLCLLYGPWTKELAKSLSENALHNYEVIKDRR